MSANRLSRGSPMNDASDEPTTGIADVPRYLRVCR